MIIRSYDREFARHGADSPQSVKWGTRQTQYFRFKTLAEIGDVSESTIFDYGCGLGDLFGYLSFQGFRGKYVGADINGTLVVAAKRKYPKAKFVLGDGFVPADYTFISGVFNDRPDKDNARQIRFVHDTVRKAFKASRKGVAFNGISTFAKRKTRGFYYVEPFDLARWCMEHVTPFVTLRHDYRLGNFTIYLYRDRGVDF